MRRLFAPFVLILVLAGCAGDLTPRQQAYDLMAKFEAAQIAVEAAVTDPKTPPEAKRYLKTAESAARQAVTAFDDATRRGDPAAAAYAGAASGAVVALLRDLAAHGFLSGDAP